MSGGRFDYKQYQIDDVADQISNLIDRQGRKRSEDFHYGMNNEGFYETYSPEVQKILRAAVKNLKKASSYTHHIDYYLSGDISEEQLMERVGRIK